MKLLEIEGGGARAPVLHSPPPPPSDATAETFVPLVDSVTDIALLETMPDIDQALLQFIDVMNLLEPLRAVNY